MVIEPSKQKQLFWQHGFILKLQVSIFRASIKAVLKEIGCLSTTKASQDTSLLRTILKENIHYFAEFICFQFNDLLRSSQFPPSFNYVTILPIFQNESSNHKNNYLPVSVLPAVSKVFKKFMNNFLYI